MMRERGRVNARRSDGGIELGLGLGRRLFRYGPERPHGEARVCIASGLEESRRVGAGVDYDGERWWCREDSKIALDLVHIIFSPRRAEWYDHRHAPVLFSAAT
jgi:hypothetical protein